MRSPEEIKVLVVAESINVEDSSGSKANVALIQNLHKIGYNVLVLHYSHREIHLPEVKCMQIKENRRSLLFLLSRIERKLRRNLKIDLHQPLENLFGFSFTLLNDSRSIVAGIKEVDDFDADLIFTLSKGASYRPHHALLNVPELHDKWLAYIHDPYPHHYYPEPYKWSEPGYIRKIEFFKQVLRSCTVAVFPSLLLKEWMQNFFPWIDEKSCIIPHQISGGTAKKVSMPSFFDSGKFNLLHAGNLMKQRPPFHLIEGFKRFQDKNPDAKKNASLLLIGNSSYHTSELKKCEKKVPNLIISDYLQQDIVLKLQQEAAVNIILESKSALSPFLPGKFPNCIEANKPILLLGPSKSEVRRLLGDDYQYWSEIDDIEKIANLIQELYESWKSSSRQTLERSDLLRYMSPHYMKEELQKLL
ncbi:UDP-glycosyltransferase [Salegentibacter chungangensis]|uniref:UDP-glycosyltransferase n=1 Tax=Salegentibacter chungangensis TaxID=1335724 RepID=A0ABW3NR02_9FLAO